MSATTLALSDIIHIISRRPERSSPDVPWDCQVTSTQVLSRHDPRDLGGEHDNGFVRLPSVPSSIENRSMQQHHTAAAGEYVFLHRKVRVLGSFPVHTRGRSVGAVRLTNNGQLLSWISPSATTSSLWGTSQWLNHHPKDESSNPCIVRTESYNNTHTCR